MPRGGIDRHWKKIRERKIEMMYLHLVATCLCRDASGSGFGVYKYNLDRDLKTGVNKKFPV
jgi:hypothetical protein